MKLFVCAISIIIMAIGMPANAGAGILGSLFGGSVDRFVRLPNGETMHFSESGNPDGKPVVMVHGWPTSARLYEPVSNELCFSRSSAYRCIAVSLIGFGRSSCPGDGSAVSPSYEVDRLDEFIAAMGLGDFALVVHDWGGPIGVAAALRHSESLSHLVVLNSFLAAGENPLVAALMGVGGPLVSGGTPLLSALSPSLVSTVMQQLTSSELSRSTLRDYKRPYQGSAGACRTQAGLNLFGKATSPESFELYEEIVDGLTGRWSGPAMFLWAEDDPVLGPNSLIGTEAHEYMEQLLPQAQTQLVPGASHYMHEDQPEAIAQAIADFVP